MLGPLSSRHSTFLPLLLFFSSPVPCSLRGMGFTLAAVVALAAISSAPVRHVLAQGDRAYDRWSPIVPNITWNACNDGNGGTGFECGYLDVPMDYANSSAGKASLAITRYPSTAQPRLGTLFVNPGTSELFLLKKKPHFE